MFDIKEELKKLPDSPGVYLHKDEFGQVIYVGKAVSLRKRVRQYFQSPEHQTAKTRELVRHISEFEYINAGSEMEALVLECSLIKKYRPKYNILLRDDKTYPYIKVTLNEEFPRITKCRHTEADGAAYFGPYASDWATNEVIDILNKGFCLKKCSKLNFGPGFKPCLNYHIHQCRGLCTGQISADEYRKTVDLAVEFLRGKDKNLKKHLNDEMNKASDELRYEDAAKFRDYISAIETISEKQRVVLSCPENLDIIIVAGAFAGFHALLFTVRDGRLQGRDSFFMGNAESDKKDIASEFIKQYYYQNTMIPKEILLAEPLDGMQLLSDWLSKEKGSNVRIFVPRRGEKKALLDVVRKDAEMMLADIDERTRRMLDKEQELRSSLISVFGNELGNKIHRIESYDISDLNGLDSVGAMVVFEDGKAVRKDYRRFKIKTVSGPDDTASMTEMLFRRYRRAIDNDPAFSRLPDIIFMDGGAGQVHSAEAVLNALNLQVPVAGMVKDDKHRTRAIYWQNKEIPLRSHHALFVYCGSIQEEVHRFAIDYHHTLRGKIVTRSVLDEIEGVGAKRKAALLEKFGSIENIKKASTEEIACTNGFNMKIAERVSEYFADKK